MYTPPWPVTLPLYLPTTKNTNELLKSLNKSVRKEMARGMCPLDPALPETLSQVKGHWPSSPWPTEGAHWPDLVKLLPLPHRLPMAASSSGPCLFSVCGTAPVNNRESANQGKAPPPHAPQLPTQKLLSSAFPVSVGQGFRAHRNPCFQVPSSLKARSMGPAKEHRRQD